MGELADDAPNTSEAHRAIQTPFDVNSPRAATQIPGLRLKDVDWDPVCTRLEHPCEEDWSIHESDDLNRGVGRPLSQVTQTVKDLRPESKPSPYYKRWWTEELTALRHEYTGIRNLHSRAKGYGIVRPDLEELAQKAKQNRYPRFPWHPIKMLIGFRLAA